MIKFSKKKNFKNCSTDWFISTLLFKKEENSVL